MGLAAEALIAGRHSSPPAGLLIILGRSASKPVDATLVY
jgi:hypothetical protein